MEFYFPQPHQPWQRGINENINENINGLLSKYFPKGYDFNQLSYEDLQRVVDQLNHRPRKCLGYRTVADLQAMKGKNINAKKVYQHKVKVPPEDDT